MQAKETSLLQLMNTPNKQFVIPIYQRAYSWKREQCVRLWQDVLSAAQGLEQTHFFGSIVYIKGEEDIPMTSTQQCLVIDGQQRLTTVTLMLVALRQLLTGGRTAGNVDVETIDDYYLFNKHAKGEQRYKLVLRGNDQDTLVHLLEQGRVDGVAQKRLRENYEFLYDEISKAPVSLDTVYEGIGKLTVVDVILSRAHDHPQRIFDSLNSTGLDLTQSDRVRNFILMDLDPERQEQLYRDYWQPITRLVFDEAQDVDHFDEFLRDYLTKESPTGEIPHKDHVYEAFREYVQQRKSSDVSAIAAQLCKNANYYARMVRPKHYSEELAAGSDDPTKATRAILAALYDINRLDMSVSYPFVIEAFDDYASGRLSEADFVGVLRMIESYVMRRLVCSIPANALNKVFARLSREVDKSQYLDSLGAALATMRGSQRFPSDEEFREAFRSKDIYHQQTRVKYILERLENYGKKELIFVTDALTVEHIMPQKLSDDWKAMLGDQWSSTYDTRLHTLGNLTLTGYNSSYSNASFIQKRDMVDPATGNLIGFRGSPVTLNQDLAQLDHWDEATILARTERLARLACAVWPAPQVEFLTSEANGKAGAKLDAVIANVFPAEGQLAYARALTSQLLAHLDANTTARLLAVTCTEDGISLEVGNWLMLRFERQKSGKQLITLVVDQQLLSPADWIGLERFGEYSSTIFAVAGATFEPHHFRLVGKEWTGREPISERLLGAWTSAIDEANVLFRQWKTGAFTRLHRDDLLKKLAPSLAPDHVYEHFLQGDVGQLYEDLNRRLMDLDPEFDVERLAVYIAYKLDTNILDVVPKTDRLTIYLNMPFEEVVDHDDMVRDVSQVGHAGNGEVMVDLLSTDQLKAVLDLAGQSLRWHAEH